jgi:hypothetical protein
MSNPRFAYLLTWLLPVLSMAGPAADSNLPAPIISAPNEGLKYSLGSKQPLPLNISLARALSATKEEVTWHIVVLRADSSEGSDFDNEVAEFAGPLTSPQIGLSVVARLTPKWFIDHGGAGRYRLKTFLTRKLASGTATGPASAVTFEVVAPP